MELEARATDVNEAYAFVEMQKHISYKGWLAGLFAGVIMWLIPLAWILA